MIELGWDSVGERAAQVVRRMMGALLPRKGGFLAYGIPNGGIPAVQVVQVEAARLEIEIHLTESPNSADCYVDDIIDSGATRDRVIQQHGAKPLFALVDKTAGDKDEWYSFPWERMTGQGEGLRDNIVRILQYIGEDPTREGLVGTPERVERSYATLFAGYKQKPEDMLTVFEVPCDEMVVVRGIEFYSMCEHHLLPFFGRAHIAYIPDGKVIGVSKLVRLLEVYARRLQIQERLCGQVTAALDDLLKPKGSACVLEAKHLCMTSRGVEKQHSEMVTSSLTGVFREKGNAARQEFLSMVKG